MLNDRFLILFRLWRAIYIALPLLSIGLVAWRAPGFGRRRFRQLENCFGRASRNRAIGALLVFAFSLAIALSISLLVRRPAPVIADEFSYILAGDTFARGRMTNPPHPMWRHFETLHVIQQPTYASKYPPAQGLALAAGQLLTGSPVAGVMLSTALALVAVYWMLLGCFSRRLSLLGGLLAALHPMIIEWGQNFWGGSVALAGGALVAGSFLRFWSKDIRYRDGLILGAGLAILANSRPFEGMVLGLLFLSATLLKLKSSEAVTLQNLILKGALPAGLVLAFAGSAMALYNLRVTGNPLRMPYAVHEETYAVAPAFIFQNPRPEPVYRHDWIRRFYTGYALESYLSQKGARGFINKGLIRKTGVLLRGYISNAAMVVALLALPWVWRRDRRMRAAFAILACFIAALYLETWMMPHYAAPGACLLFIVAVQGMRSLRAWSCRGQRTGLWLARAAVAFSLLGIINVGFRIARDERGSWGWAAERSRIERTLASGPERHLVIVRYSPSHVSHQEWVFNSADPDGSSIVWARDMGAEENRELLDFYADRRAWLLEADTHRLSPYPRQAIPQRINH